MLVPINEVLRALYRSQQDAGAISEAAYEMLTATCFDAELARGHPCPGEEVVDSLDGKSAEICHPASVSRRAA